MGHPSRQLQCRQAGLCGGMWPPCLLLVPPAAKGVAGHDSLHQRGKGSPSRVVGSRMQ